MTFCLSFSFSKRTPSYFVIKYVDIFSSGMRRFVNQVTVLAPHRVPVVQAILLKLYGRAVLFLE